ncbi:PWI domain-containing protein [Clohesyomyces aquaticus]|uniref:PWI domain-containing protein n=1 Tax=Clohesyomyces aquaticus TaxID=1231657 RepID=A0A1Y1ZXM8_9PLEO|nr:PWI domain-containing protein [Clohesyomyces aquaticus]
MAMSVDQKRLKETKFPPEFNKKVDTSKVNVDLLKKWIASKITAILGDEDDVVIDTCFNLLEESQFPNIKAIQIQLTGFLGNKECPEFCKELWNLMLSAQDSPRGVPKELLEAKKLEMKQEQASKAAAESRRQQEREQNEMIDSFRRSERPERGHDRGPERGSDRGRGGRGGRGRGFDDRPGRGRDRGDFNRRPPRRDSRSPPPRSPPYVVVIPMANKVH